ncbi:hypothetical protein DYQ48_11470 [Xanthomonas hortorum]|nr:hypothetical protein DYQ48_11470 [Xanthomonas hortorum]
MICSSVKRFFTSNLLGVGNWTPNWGATQNWVDVAATPVAFTGEKGGWQSRWRWHRPMMDLAIPSALT